MRILYGVVGEGMGHAIRSRVVLDHLLKNGHEVEIVTSSRAAEFLGSRFPEVHRIHGLHIATDANRVLKSKTLVSNVVSGVRAVPSQIRSYFKLIEDFRPEVVVSDFESWSYLFGIAHDLPVISVDNIQILNRCKHPEAIREGHEADYRLTRSFVKSKLPFCHHYVVTTFFYPKTKTKKRTTLVPPILRPEILSARPSDGDHLLVYQTAVGNQSLLDALEASQLPCRIYGMRRELTSPQVEGRLTYMPFSEDGFIDDLRSCRGVVASAGFTLMGESVFLRKPFLAVPLAGQFEQLLNARWLERLDYGMAATSVDRDTLTNFITKLDGCRDALSGYDQAGNSQTFDVLDSLLDRAAAGLLRR